MRPDVFSQLLLFSNVMAGANTILYEECTGLLIGALLQRLAGNGRLYNVHAGDNPNVGITKFFNLSPREQASLVHLNFERLKSIVIPGYVSPRFVPPQPAPTPQAEERRLQREEVRILSSFLFIPTLNPPCRSGGCRTRRRVLSSPRAAFAPSSS